MANINSVLKEVLQRYKISDSETARIKKQANKIVKLISKSSKLKVAIGGSLAKGTMISKQVQDVDIFVVFKNEEETKKLESILNKNFKGKLKLIHGSRDYFQISGDGVVFEIIPIVDFDSPEQVKNVSDFSLTHVSYIGKKLGKNKKLADEIKLAKIFCHAQECYGAESYISGFSGYSLELLVYYFGSFIKFLKGIDKKRVIDVEKAFRNEKEIRQELNESKLQSPVILIDPTYKYRNACAGLSKETFENFLEISKKFLKKPNLDFFIKTEIDVEELGKSARKNKARLSEIKITTDKQEGDIAGTKMKKFFNFLIMQLEEKGQKILKSEFKYDGKQEARGYIILREVNEIEVKGPPVSNKKAIASFKQVRKKIYNRNGFAYAKKEISLDEIFNFVRQISQEMNVEFEVL